jgi:hypothetical protein
VTLIDADAGFGVGALRPNLLPTRSLSVAFGPLESRLQLRKNHCRRSLACGKAERHVSMLTIGIARDTYGLRHENKTQEISRHGDEIRDAFLQVRDVAETARLVGLSEALVRRALGEMVPDFEILTRVPRDPSNPSKKYSMDDLMDALREAAHATPGILAENGYDAFVAEHPTLPDGRPRPGKQTMKLRFGFWRDALMRADLPANPRSGPGKEFNETDAIAAVVECWRRTGGPPTADGYDVWQRGQEGRPSTATVRAGRQLEPAAGPCVAACPRSDARSGRRGCQRPPTTAARRNTAVGGAVRTILRGERGRGGVPPGRSCAAEYNTLERAVRSHALIQNTVATAAAAAGLEPLVLFV